MHAEPDPESGAPRAELLRRHGVLTSALKRGLTAGTTGATLLALRARRGAARDPWRALEARLCTAGWQHGPARPACAATRFWGRILDPGFSHLEMNKATYVSVATSAIGNVLSDAVGGSDGDEEDRAATE